MTEHRTSNPRCAYCSQHLLIERLTAELAGTKDELHSVDKAAKELGAERDRLTTELDAAEAVATYNRDMADRLRVALEYVDSYCSETLPDMVMDKIRQALAGAADETAVVHGCFCRDVELGNARSCPIHGPAENTATATLGATIASEASVITSEASRPPELPTRDCRIIHGSPGVIITQEAAREALRSMELHYKDGFGGLYADDRSFVIASMRELKRAAENGTDA